MNKETEQISAKEGSVTIQLRLQNKVIAELINQILILEERFKSVLSQAVQAEEAVQKELQKPCELTITLQVHNRLIGECIDRVNFLIGRCEL